MGDAHFTASVQATADVQLILPKTLSAPCQTQVTLPSFHDEISVTDGGWEGDIKRMIINAMHGTIQSQMQQKIGSSTTDKICSFITGCQAGIRQCAQDADAALKTCLN